MKNIIRRGFSVLFALAMLCGMALPALAENKKETVFVIADAEGNAQSVTVSERLHNPGKLNEIADYSALDNIENVGGDQTWSAQDGVIVWKADGADISYEGTSDAPLPVSVHVSYKLDGEAITPDELAGKSGHLEITIEYAATQTERVNVGGKTESMPVPFLMATVMLVDDDVYDNIEVTNGKVIDAGNMKAVLCYGLPGVYEALHLDEYDDLDIDIPSTSIITADVTDYSSSGSYTIATNSIFNSIGENNDLNLDTGSLTDDLDDAITQLMDGVDQLYEGMGELRDGAETLHDGTGSLLDGAEQLNDGLGTLMENAPDLADGVDALLDGAEQLDGGASDLLDGTQQLHDGTGNLLDGAEQLHDGAGSLLDGVEQLHDGTGSLLDGAEQLNDGLGTLADSAPDLADGVDALLDGAQQLNDGIGSLLDGANQVDEGAAALLDGVEQLDEGIETLSDGLSEIDENSDALVDGARQIFEAIIDSANDGLVVGVDVDQSPESDTVITSAMKGLSDAAQWAIAKTYDGTFGEIGGQATSLGAAENAVGLPTATWSLKNFSAADYDKLFQDILSGAVTIDDTVYESGDIANVEFSNVTVNYQ